MQQITISKSEYEELLKYKYAVTALEEEIHEKEFKEEFVKDIERVREDVKKGKKIVFKDKATLARHLSKCSI